LRVNWSDNFRELYRKRGQQKRGIRLFALWKIQEGMTDKSVCKLLGKTPNTIRSWRNSYEDGGIEGLLAIKSGRGRKALLKDTSLLVKCLQDIDSNLSGGRVQCQDIVDNLSRQHNIHYSRSGMYDALHRLGFSWITGRSKHPKQDKDKIEEFKKKLS